MAFVICVMSGKGGVGKSTTAIGLAEAFNSLGKKTLLVDADLQFGYDHVLLGKNPTCTIQDALKGRCLPEHALIEVRKNLFLLPTSNESSDDTRIDEGFLDSYESSFEIIVVDLPAGCVSDTFAFYDLLVVVVEPRAASISIVKGLHNRIIDINPNANFVAVMNKLSRRDRLNYETVLNGLDIPIIGYISDDPDCTLLGCENHYSMRGSRVYKYYVNTASHIINGTPISKPKRGWFS